MQMMLLFMTAYFPSFLVFHWPRRLILGHCYVLTIDYSECFPMVATALRV